MNRLRVILGDAGAVVLAGVSVLHVYWAAGGRRGQPGDPDVGRPPADSTVHGGQRCRRHGVGDGLCALPRGDGAMAAEMGLPRRYERRGDGAPARAIGDRRYVGFLKRSRDSAFARRDTYLYSPLCTLLAVAGAVAAA